MANIRLLACTHCKTIETLPDFDGPPDYDRLLQNLVSRHMTPEGYPHIGQLFNVSEEEWAIEGAQTKIRDQIATALSGGETGLGSAFYDLKDTFVEDAGECFKAHNRNPGCGDYKSDSKILTSGNEKEMKDLGIQNNSKRYLCEFCPVHSLVQQAQRRKAGLDK
jgi:hypothetical protein